MKNLVVFFSMMLAAKFGFGASIPQVDQTIGDNEDSLKSVVKPVSFYDTSSIFTQDWNVNITFSYADKSIDGATNIPLIDSVHSYAFPIEKETTSGFGPRHGRQHKGIDIPLKTGEAIVAAFDGKVRYAKYNGGGFGNLIIIRHVNGLETYYAHLSKIKVKPNQIVKAGELIGLGGCTGRSYSPHLHFEVRYHDTAFDPEKIFDTHSYCLREEQALVSDLMKRRTYKQHTPKLNEDFLAGGTVYAIRKGDTLSKIAARNGTTVEQLCNLNGLDRNAILQIGQRIRVD